MALVQGSDPLSVEDYLDNIEDMSKELLNRVVNMTDVNGNTALHYSVSHGNFDVVSVLLDSKVANPNILNKVSHARGFQSISLPLSIDTQLTFGGFSDFLA